MANTTSVFNPKHVLTRAQDYRNKMLVGVRICDTRYSAMLSDGDRIDFGYMTDIRKQTYTPGTDLTIDSTTATADYLDITTVEAATFQIDETQLKQSAVKNMEAQLAFQSTHQLGSSVDQAVLYAGTSQAANSLYSGATQILSGATAFDAFADAGAELDFANAGPGGRFAVVDPAGAAKIEKNFVANGFQSADLTLRNGFRGSFGGFDVYVSNNLRSTVTLKEATLPTAGDTFTIAGVTWTFVADGTAAAAGDISLTGNAAAVQLLVRAAINGTGTPGVSTYIDVSTNNRRKLQNAQVSCAVFGGDLAVITGYGRLNPSETYTAAADGFSTQEVNNYLFGVYGAIALGMQQSPKMKVNSIPHQLADEYLMYQLFGTDVFERDTYRLAKMANQVTAATV